MTELIHGDALLVANHLAKSSVDLVYLDPPFNVGTKFRARTTDAGATSRVTGPVAYRDQFPSKTAFLDWLFERLNVIHGLLASTGSLWLHLDQRTVHEAKVRLDALFGEENFRGEVIWVPGNGGRGNGPTTTHQTLLFYSKTDEFTWNAKDPELREPYAKTSLSMHFKERDEDGRHYRERTIGKKTYRYYADLGRLRGSVWSDCPSMLSNTPLRSETTGYPTQKPLALLERIVRATSNEGDLVLDPFMGSGTTLEAALKHGRRAVGSDIGELSITTVTKRLQRAGHPVEVVDASSRTASHRAKPRAKRAPAPRARRSGPAS